MFTGSSLVVQWVKELEVLLLQGRFDPQPRNFCVLWTKTKKGKKNVYRKDHINGEIVF